MAPRPQRTHPPRGLDSVLQGLRGRVVPIPQDLVRRGSWPSVRPDAQARYRKSRGAHEGRVRMPPAMWTCLRCWQAWVLQSFGVAKTARFPRSVAPEEAPMDAGREGVKAPPVDSAPPHELRRRPRSRRGARTGMGSPAAGGRGMRPRGCPAASAASERLTWRGDGERHEKGRSGQQCARRKRVTSLAVDGLHRILLQIPWSLDPSRNRLPRIPRWPLRCASTKHPTRYRFDRDVRYLRNAVIHCVV